MLLAPHAQSQYFYAANCSSLVSGHQVLTPDITTDILWVLNLRCGAPSRAYTMTLPDQDGVQHTVELERYSGSDLTLLKVRE